MEDQNSIINELLERKDTTEKLNTSLKQQIAQKKLELTKLSSELTKPSNSEPNKIIISKKLPTEEEKEIAARKAFVNYRSLKMNQINITNNCEVCNLEYRSQEHYNKLYIMGDFTKWELIPMKKSKDSFSYKVILLKGFKYYYSFQADDQILLDYDSTYEANPKNSQVQNYIDLNEPNQNKKMIFDSESDMSILQLAQQNYFLAQLNLTEEEFFFLTKFKHHLTISKQIDQELRKKTDKLYSSVNIYFNEITKCFNPYSKHNHISQFRSYLKNKILAKNSENNITYYFRILNISDMFSFQCVKLYDNNHIKIDTNYYTYSGFYYTVIPSQITTKKIEPGSKQYHLLPFEESEKILDEYNKDDKNILKAYFKTLLNLKNDASEREQNDINDFNTKRNMILVTPKKIEPQGINLDDYEFLYSLNRITRVRNKKEGSEVLCTIIDESAEKNKLPNIYEIYYGVVNEKIFLIHCHVLDKNLYNVKLITKEININEDPHLLKKNEEYIKNNQILLITQGQNILKLYYKGKKVKMKHVKIEENKLYILQSPNPDSIFNRMYVTVKNLSEKIKSDLIEQCNQYTYSLDEMQNGVNVQVVFDAQKNYVSEPMILSVSPCLLKQVHPYEEHALRQKMPKTEEEKAKEKEREKEKEKEKEEFMTFRSLSEMDKYFHIAQKMGALRQYKNKETINKMTQEEKKKLIRELEEYRQAMELILIFIETNEMWENLDEAMSISSEIIEIINLLNKK